MLRAVTAKRKLLVVSIELIIFAIYALFAITTYRKTELLFTENNMLLRDEEDNLLRGGGIYRALIRG